MSKIHYSSLLQTRKHPIVEPDALTEWFTKLTAANRRKLAILHEKQNGKCCFCKCDTRLVLPGEKYKKKNRATLDHIVPQHFGGTHSLKNLAMACSGCNSTRGTMDFDEFKHLVESKKLHGYLVNKRKEKKQRERARSLLKIIDLAVLMLLLKLEVN